MAPVARLSARDREPLFRVAAQLDQFDHVVARIETELLQRRLQRQRAGSAEPRTDHAHTVRPKQIVA
jgi:hypothetical protein